jgi:hypothetical protein
MNSWALLASPRRLWRQSDTVLKVQERWAIFILEHWNICDLSSQGADIRKMWDCRTSLPPPPQNLQFKRHKVQILLVVEGWDMGRSDWSKWKERERDKSFQHQEPVTLHLDFIPFVFYPPLPTFFPTAFRLRAVVIKPNRKWIYFV